MSRTHAGLTAAAIALCGVVGAPCGSAALDLETALRQVAVANPLLAERRATGEAARRRADTMASWPSPVLSLGMVNVPTSGRFDADPMTMKTIGISQGMPVFGRVGLARRSATMIARAQDDATETAALELLGEAWGVYSEAFFANEIARHEEEHGAVMDRMVDAVLANYKSGGGSYLEIARAQAERARVLADMLAARAAEQSALARLDVLMGQSRPTAPGSLTAPPLPNISEDTSTWLDAVSPTHPRLRALAADAKGYEFAGRAARRRAWPDFMLHGSYGFRETPFEGHEFVTRPDLFSATVSFTLPLLGRGAHLAEGAAMEALAQARLAQRAAAELELRRQIMGAHAEALLGQRRVKLLADTVVTAQRRALDSALSTYGVGETGLAEVLESGHALLAGQIALSRARQQLAAVHARLVAITGRGDLLNVKLSIMSRETR